MSQFSPEIVEHLADLARIDLTFDEIKHLSKELSVIEGSINQLSDVISSDIEPTSHPVDLKNVLREDIPEKPLTQKQALAGAPETQDNMFSSPQILDEE
jgi:aspartyl-tRNA(Asn)/glutamyl-tRNA(Gln) amidotransferase subunit C